MDRLAPSPVENLRLAAQAARADAEPEIACSLLMDAAELDPSNQTVQLDLAEIHIEMQNVDAAQAILLARDYDDNPRRQALLARIDPLAAAGAELATLKVRIENNAADLDARLRLAQALASAQDYRPALEQLLESIRHDRQWQDAAARKAMLDIFRLLDEEARHADLAREFRALLARALN
jgi:putative thioredoxin